MNLIGSSRLSLRSLKTYIFIRPILLPWVYLGLYYFRPSIEIYLTKGDGSVSSRDEDLSDNLCNSVGNSSDKVTSRDIV